MHVLDHLFSVWCIALICPCMQNADTTRSYNCNNTAFLSEQQSVRSTQWNHSCNNLPDDVRDNNNSIHTLSLVKYNTKVSYSDMHSAWSFASQTPCVSSAKLTPGWTLIWVNNDPINHAKSRGWALFQGWVFSRETKVHILKHGPFTQTCPTHLTWKHPKRWSSCSAEKSQASFTSMSWIFFTMISCFPSWAAQIRSRSFKLNTWGQRLGVTLKTDKLNFIAWW